jgi:hypothetical protein
MKETKINNVVKEYKDFYNKNIKKVHVICSILGIILFLIFLVAKINEISTLNVVNSKVSYFGAVKENLMLTFIIIFAGITPYVFLPILGYLAIYDVALKVAYIYVIHKNIFYLIFLIILAVIAIVGYSLIIATGIYYCILSSKKFTYSQKKGFNFNDFKASIYKLRNNEKKLEEYEKKKQKKLKEIEKLNVKSPYRYFIISFVITNILLLFTTIVIR